MSAVQRRRPPWRRGVAPSMRLRLTRRDRPDSCKPADCAIHAARHRRLGGPARSAAIAVDRSSSVRASSCFSASSTLDIHDRLAVQALDRPPPRGQSPARLRTGDGVGPWRRDDLIGLAWHWTRPVPASLEAVRDADVGTISARDPHAAGDRRGRGGPRRSASRIPHHPEVLPCKPSPFESRPPVLADSL